MSSEHPDRQTTLADKPSQVLSIPRWAVMVTALIMLLPVLIMSSMMLMMGLIGLPMHGGMAASSLGLFAIFGVIPLLLALGVIYGIYQLYTTDRE